MAAAKSTNTAARSVAARLAVKFHQSQLNGLVQVAGPELANDDEQAIFLAAMAHPGVVAADDPYAAFEGRKGAELRAVSAMDDSKLVEYSLKAMPVFDGMIAANRR